MATSTCSFAPTISSPSSTNTRVFTKGSFISTSPRVSGYKTTTARANESKEPSREIHPLMMWNNDDDSITGRDRIASCIPYALPLLDGDQFGRFIYQRIPILGMLDSIFIAPLASLYHSIPFLGLGLFVLLSFGSRNPNLSRGVRYNMQQAILIDIALIFPELFGSLGGSAASMPRFVVEPATNFIYYCLVAAVLYSVVSNLSGKKPNQIPIISEAAEQGVGPM
eukprot:CAMPEP_0195522616 /NCGR_PEP_ID=MMETSP0794_2-20130614/20954_1 /TAXON_ID=515487 /ORGANISM="Stephanopyxis turris, Strain CCMP 815" /LENGTH=223 /DNA_ID=CAMNT_0040652413 /DNA_START=163 /DNA_END=834 /DNA_ORIENTATION=-